MNPFKIIITVEVSPEGVEVIDATKAAVLVDESQAPAPAELDQPEAALEADTVVTMGASPTDEEAGLVLDVTMPTAPGPPLQVESGPPPPLPLEDLDNLSDSA